MGVALLPGWPQTTARGAHRERPPGGAAAVRILDRDYRLAVSAEEKPRLIEAARAVDERMRALREAGRVSGTDRIAVMAALQLADELIGLREAAQGTPSAPDTEASKRVRRMTETIDDALKRQESLF